MLRSGGVTDIGKVRKINQDNFNIIEDKNIFIVADGMGGHAAGDQASRIAVSTITEVLSSYDFATEIYVPKSTSMSVEELLRLAVQEANEQILLTSMSNPDLQGMGTTVVLTIYTTDGQIYIGNVGDSRIYLIRQQQITKVTKDHSVVQQLIDAGMITEEEAEVHPYKNVITRCLGQQAVVEPDTQKLALEDGDWVLLCTDGLSNMVSSQQMVETLALFEDPQEACTQLVTMANEKGGTDNITVVLLHYTAKSV